jgi:Holliday junction resolvase RusA-like endonuclease
MEQHVTVYIEPQPAPRPRFNKNSGAYNPPKYTQYLQELKSVLEPLENKQIKEGDWNEVEVRFYFKYPKGTPKSSRRVLEYHRYKCDCDNLVKPILDVMQELQWIKDDKQISKLMIVKLQGEMSDSKIEISLFE